MIKKMYFEISGSITMVESNLHMLVTYYFIKFPKMKWSSIIKQFILDKQKQLQEYISKNLMYINKIKKQNKFGVKYMH